MTTRARANRPMLPLRTALECKDHPRHTEGIVLYEHYTHQELHESAARRMAKVDAMSKRLREDTWALGQQVALVFQPHPSMVVSGPPKPQAKGNFALCKRGQRFALRLGIKSAKIIELNHELSLEELGL
jgi:hypothetical protein